ncbi:winged helix-turn-helix domain-containing protein [Azospirillum sp. HJ39]|uniref:ArsR/SmtB family transcription factor n=1 Tax=Azospirillum sp. HJ39 TaxID=3159496 RepID=UPI003558EBED
MVTANRIAEVAAAVGEPARAAMLSALMDGRALTAAELARVAAITPQTASGHLARLVDAGLVAVERQGRHRYHRLANRDVALMIEGMMQVAGSGGGNGGGGGPARRLRVGPADQSLRLARTCYDHLAGRVAVEIADALVAMGAVEIEQDAGIVTPAGLALMERIGIALPDPSGRAGKGRAGCRPCLDWSERRPHLAGRLGAALCAHAFERGWIRRIEGSRAVTVTVTGRAAFHDAFGIRIAGRLREEQ